MQIMKEFDNHVSYLKQMKKRSLNDVLVGAEI